MCSLVILLFVYSDFRNTDANIIGKHPFIVSFLSCAVKKKPKEYVLFRQHSVIKALSNYMTTGKGVCPHPFVVQHQHPMFHLRYHELTNLFISFHGFCEAAF
jgi:hypothetical protein